MEQYINSMISNLLDEIHDLVSAKLQCNNEKDKAYYSGKIEALHEVVAKLQAGML